MLIHILIYMVVIILSKAEWQHLSGSKFRVVENCRFNYLITNLADPHSILPGCHVSHPAVAIMLQFELRALAMNGGVVYGHWVARVAGSDYKIMQ